MLRKLIYVGMMTATSRANFLKTYIDEYKIVKNVEDVTHEEVYSDMKELA